MEKSNVGAIINRPQKNQGITLIALIVTIIILIILAGITIALISGGNGIMSKATAAVDKNNIETAKEQVTLKIGEYQSDYYEGRYVTLEIGNEVKQGDWIYENYEGKTKDYEFTITPNGENPYIVTILKNKKLPGEVKGTLSVDGKLEWEEVIIADSSSRENSSKTEAGKEVKIPDDWMTETMRYISTDTGKEVTGLTKVATVYAVSDGAGNKVPVPYGFWYVGGNLDTGVIISDNEADKYDGKTDKTTWEYTTNLKGNQFVWIPCTKSEYHKTEWGSSYQNTNWDSTTYQGEMTQIKKYGGFYVARYEAGLASGIEEFTTTQIQTDSNQIYNLEGIPQSKAGQIPWNFIDWNMSKSNAESMYNTEYVTSGLITGTQWDVMLNKLVEKTDLTENDLKSSESWGNHSNTVIHYKGRLAKAEYINSSWYLNTFGIETEGETTNYNETDYGDLLTTGASSETEKYHIYDVAGNLLEWTEEVSLFGGDTGTQYRVSRGGRYVDMYARFPVAYRMGGYYNNWISASSRLSSCTLY